MLAGTDGLIAECRVPLPCSSIQAWAGSTSAFGIVALSGSSSGRFPRGHVTLAEVRGLDLNVLGCKLTNTRVLDGCLFLVDDHIYLAAADGQGYLTVWNYLASDVPLRAWQAHTGAVGFLDHVQQSTESKKTSMPIALEFSLYRLSALYADHTPRSNASHAVWTEKQGCGMCPGSLKSKLSGRP
uniref:Uncharacterized protein n=1 Tax=Rhodosorus marinus TaxID=101924 RepID=A0A7S2ZJV5_9RHOD